MAGRFLAEGAPAVSEALRTPDAVTELFVTPATVLRHPDLVGTAHSAGIPVSEISPKAAAALSETVTPQGLVATCGLLDVALTTALDRRPSLIVAVVDVQDPGNAGTIVRTADAAGAGAVVFAGESVDPYNGKAVRAGAGSVFHLDLVAGHPTVDLIAAARAAGYQVLAATGAGTALLDQCDLRPPTMWLFGNEAQGLAPHAVQQADHTVRVPIYGRAESLNLAAAAAVCLYASAHAQHRASPGVSRDRD